MIIEIDKGPRSDLEPNGNPDSFSVRLNAQKANEFKVFFEVTHCFPAAK